MEARHWCQIWVSTNGTEISVRTFPLENKKFSLHYKVNRVSLGSLVGIATSTVFSCSTGFPMKWHPRNEHRISKLMMHDHPDLSGASDWLKQICQAAWQITGFACTLKVLPWWNYSCCGRTTKDRLKALFCTEWSPSKMGKVFLKVLEKSMNFLFQKGYKPCNQKHYPDLGSDTSSVWNFCTHFSDIILRRNQWLCCEMLLFSQPRVEGCKGKCFLWSL